MCSSESCRNNMCTYLIIFGIIASVFALTGMLCFTAGYISNKNFNEGLTLTECTVLSTGIYRTECSYTCSCNAQGICQQCYYTCYNGYIYTYIPDVTPQTGNRITVIWQIENRDTVKNYLDYYYPPNRKFRCYYNTNYNVTNSVSIELGLKDYQTSFYVGIVFCSLSALTIVTFLCFVVYGYLPLLFGKIDYST